MKKHMYLLELAIDYSFAQVCSMRIHPGSFCLTRKSKHRTFLQNLQNEADVTTMPASHGDCGGSSTFGSGQATG